MSEQQPRLLLAPDSFKGTFSAIEVASALAAGARRGGWNPDVCPVADGGEGTMDVLVAVAGGEVLTARVTGPLGRPVTACFALMADRDTAIVEMAQASGLGLVPPAERDAERASTFGTGELILAARGDGASRILVAVGGSATTDGGAGAIEAIEQGGGLQGAELTVLCDVTTPYEQAASVFAAQKGADPAAVERLARRLHQWRRAFPRIHAGAR